MQHKLEIERRGGDYTAVCCAECGTKWHNPTRTQIAEAQGEPCPSFWQPEPECIEATTMRDPDRSFIRVGQMGHIHTREDGRGIRDVYLDGRLIRGCFYADTERGIVRAYVEREKDFPGQLVSWAMNPATGELETVELTGKVEVVCKAD